MIGGHEVPPSATYGLKQCALATATVATLLVSEVASAQEALIRFRLPSCPTEMILHAPATFEGAASQEQLLKAYQPFLFADTQGVFAAASPANPDIALLIVEPSRIGEI